MEFCQSLSSVLIINFQVKAIARSTTGRHLRIYILVFGNSQGAALIIDSTNKLYFQDQHLHRANENQRWRAH